MILQGWAARFRAGQNVNFGRMFEPKMRRKSIKTEVRKRMKNETLCGRHFCRFRHDFDAQDLPKKRPKTTQKSSGTHVLDTWAENLSLDGRGVAICTVLGASGTDFGRFRNDFETILGRFLEGSGP